MGRTACGKSHKLGLSELEFSDIKEDVKEKADKYIDNEVADSYDEALTLALNAVKPSLAKDLKAKRNTKTSKMSKGRSATKSEKSETQKLEDKFSADMPKGWSAK